MDKDRMVAKMDRAIQKQSSFDILLFSREDSSYKNNVEIRVPKQEINPRRVFFNPKNTMV